MRRGIGIFSLAAAILVPFASPVGAEETHMPGASHSACDLQVLRNGSLVTRCGSRPVSAWGPGMPGELRHMGDFVPALLDPELEPKPSPAGGRLADLLVVVIDAGHGGSQLGAVGAKGTKEKDIVLLVAEQTRTALAAIEGVEVVMTRLGDDEISLFDRVDAANQVRADLFISVHANGFVTPHLGGVETFFHSIEASDEEARRVASAENALAGKRAEGATDTLSYILQDMHSAEKLRDSSRLAHLVQDELARILPFENRGVMQADFIVLRDTGMPSVLVELGFLSNPREEKILCDTKVHKQIAAAIKHGVVQYWELVKRKQVRIPRGANPMGRRSGK